MDGPPAYWFTETSWRRKSSEGTRGMPMPPIPAMPAMLPAMLLATSASEGAPWPPDVDANCCWNCC
jgi:hypothetical protein